MEFKTIDRTPKFGDLPNEELIRNLNELHIQEQQKDQFISVASHELNTPVTTTKLYLHILEEYCKKNGDVQYLQYVEKAGHQLNKLSGLIADLLDVSRLNDGRFELHMAEVDVDDLVQKTISAFQKSSLIHEILLIGHSNAKVLGDRERLQQVLNNLLSNAVKFSPRANKVEVTLTREENMVNISVKDFGVGIEEKYHSLIFSRFFRMNDKDKNTYPGLGIGLYISSQIILAHHGHIRMDSILGKESNFVFTLPILS